MSDNVNNPEHYNSHPSGVECINIVEHMSFNIGNAIKYLWRQGLKGSSVEDLRKAVWYINREIQLQESNVRIDGITPLDFLEKLEESVTYVK